MALPIAATPVLTGEDVERFYKELEENENKNIPQEEIAESITIFNTIMDHNPEMKRKFGIA